MKKKVQLEGMKCSNCVEHVKKVLGDLNDTTDIQVDLGSQLVLLETTVSDELIKQTIDDAGFSVLGID
ncbi:heavy-metal-associated domain-containing protein [Turicibacter sp. TJ11]|uniref:heavy-metal-associated domain-containing protein n=1 Tax=Turicibacter sp. TJ11 TaxID=2806443 RepID=UPI001F274CE8|nr:heavy-metal-associated domain-containing protein [Turicibacter sp. TJ11]